MWARSIALERLVLATAVLLTVWGIGSFGIWDPWELVVADAALGLSGASSLSVAPGPLATSAIAFAFDLFGIREWSGRLPGLIFAGLTYWLAFRLLRRPFSRRAGVIAIAVMASTPMFLLNARLLFGDCTQVFAQTWVGVAALAICSERSRQRRRLAHYLALILSVAVSAHTSGVLLGPLPPLLAVCAWIWLSEDDGRGDRISRWLLPLIALVLFSGVLRAVRLDDPNFSPWLGGGAVGGNPPTFDSAFELVFHGLAPWSAALPVAALGALFPRPGRSKQAQRLAWVLLLWAAFAYVSWTVYASRYGTPPYLAVVPLAALVGIWLAELDRDPDPHWASAVVVGLLAVVLIRDYALYPISPLQALAIDGLNVPDVYHPGGGWALLLSLSAMTLGLTLVSRDSSRAPRPARTVQWFRDQWERSWAGRIWLLAAGVVTTGCLTFGLTCFAFDLHLTSLAIRVGRVAFFLPFAASALVFGLPYLRHAYARLGDLRVFPALGAGLAVGAFVTLSFQPALSAHFSPKPVYDAYSQLTEGRPEALVTYQLPTSAAHYYTHAKIVEVKSRRELFDFLASDEQAWAVIRSEHLAELDRAHRRETGKHLYVADARSERLLLIAARPIAGRSNESFITRAVLGTAPSPEHAVGARFEDRIELIGYDIDLPGDSSVGAGQRFTVTWYWRVLGNAPVGYKVFVHIDAHGLRLNGDHPPVEGRYATRLWDEGDVIADTQRLRVPANFPAGDYSIYVGWFSGSKRLPVTSGPQDGENRVEAGVLSVR